MSQRYTPSQLALIIDAGSALALYPSTAMSGLEMNTLIMAGEFSVALANCVVKPWVNIKSKDTSGDKIDNWLPLDPVTLTAEAPTASAPPLTNPGRFRAPPAETALPNCHEVKVELISISAGNVNLWGATANRPPR